MRQPQRLGAQRTTLLHRMLLVRHLIERGAAVPLGDRDLAFRIGEEAVAAGAWAALGHADTVVRAGADPRNAPAGVLIRLIDEGDVRDVALGSDLLVCRLCGSAAGTGRPAAVQVDGLDVEAVLAAVRTDLAAVRAGRCGRLIDLCMDIPGHPDPVATLVVRMYADHQLDACALRAIDADTATRVAATLALRSGGAES
jgi:hypothetical protein